MLAAVIAAAVIITSRPTRATLDPGHPGEPPVHIDAHAGVLRLEREVRALPHSSVGPYCLGAVDTTGLELLFRRRTEIVDGFKQHSELLLASAPRSGSTWLAKALEDAARYQHVHTTHFPFFTNAAQPSTDKRDVLLLVRNPFDSFRSYMRNLEELNRIQHRTSFRLPKMSLDEFIGRWRIHNDFWRSHYNASIVHYEHLLGDPMQVLGHSFSLSTDLVLAARAKVADAQAPPLIDGKGKCGRALDGLVESGAELKRIVHKHGLGEYGFIVVQGMTEWTLVSE